MCTAKTITFWDENTEIITRGFSYYSYNGIEGVEISL